MFLEAELESFRKIRKDLRAAQNETKELKKQNLQLKAKISPKVKPNIEKDDPNRKAAQSLSRILRRWYPEDYMK